jgi:hypothetical protein
MTGLNLTLETGVGVGPQGKHSGLYLDSLASRAPVARLVLSSCYNKQLLNSCDP